MALPLQIVAPNNMPPLPPLPPLPPVPMIDQLPFHGNPFFYDFPEFNSPNPTNQFPDFNNTGNFMERRLYPMDMAKDRQRLFDQYLMYKNASEQRMDTTGLTDEIMKRILWELEVMKIIGEAQGIVFPRLTKKIFGEGIGNVSSYNMDDLLRQASKQTIVEALRELGDRPDVKQTKAQLLERLSTFIEPRQRGGFLGALARIALPIAAEQFVQHRLDNPDSQLGPNRITEVNMLGDATKGKFTNQGLMSLGRR